MSTTTKKFADVNDGVLNVKGVPVPDITTIGIVTPAAVTATLYFTFDTWEEIEAGTATYIEDVTVAADSGWWKQFEYCPNGIKIVGSGAGVTAWVKT